MKEKKLFYLLINIATALFALVTFLVNHEPVIVIDFTLLVVMISYIVLLVSSIELFFYEPKVTDIKLGREFRIIAKH